MLLRLYPVDTNLPNLHITGVEWLTETPEHLEYKMKRTEGDPIRHPTIANGAAGEWEINGVRYNSWLFEGEGRR